MPASDQLVTDFRAFATADARTGRLSADWQFWIAHNAALKLCTILLSAEGYRPERNLAHFRTLQALPLILGETQRDDADYLDQGSSMAS